MPTRVLHLLPTLEPSDAATRVALLRRSLPQQEFEQHVAVLNATGRVADRLRESPAGVHVLKRRFRRDPLAAFSLRRLAGRLRPDVAHAWGGSAARYAAAAGLRHRVVTVGADDLGGVLLGRRPSDRLFEPPLSAPAPPSEAPHDREALGLPTGVRLIGVVARLEPASRVKHLIWAIDLVRVLAPDVWLVVIGDGPQRASLAEFSRLACEESRTLLLGEREDVPHLLPHFDLVWHAGAQPEPPLALLQAQAAGVPAVADAHEGAAMALDDGVTGALVPPGDRAARAKATLKLLKDDATRQQMAEAARSKAAEQWPLSRLIDACAELYRRGL